jgi:hypothetical protein
MQKFRFTEVSRNPKTGPMPVTTTQRDSCPDCIFKGNGCYADNFPLSKVWRETEIIGITFAQLCDKIRELKAGTIFRHNQAGDLPGVGNRINTRELKRLVSANSGRHGFTYTHKPMTPRNLDAVKHANRHGFTINLSGNNLSHADSLVDLNAGPVVSVVPIDQVTNTLTPAGRKVTICPAAIDDSDTINCKSCKLCSISSRATIIGFPAHGASKRKASTVANGS